jgi:hypothetical protein
VERVVKHWWNGRWGRLARRDVYVKVDSEPRSVVEARADGAEGRIKRQECRDEREALVLAERWREFGGDDWADISGAHRPRGGIS